jgi:hypothetical protein
LARAARGRTIDLEAPLAEMEEAWERSMGIMVERYGR